MVNGELAEVTRILATNDLVQLRFDVRAAHKSVYGREKLSVRYEDEELAVVVKPSGRTMVSFGFMLPYSLQASSTHVDQETHGLDEEELLIEDDEEAAEGADNDDDDFEIPVNISPAVGIQRVPCAIHGLEKAANGLVSLKAQKKESNNVVKNTRKLNETNVGHPVGCNSLLIGTGRQDGRDAFNTFEDVYVRRYLSDFPRYLPRRLESTLTHRWSRTTTPAANTLYRYV